MKALLLLLTVGLVWGRLPLTHKELEEHWSRFKDLFRKEYEQHEERYRRAIWERNVHHIIGHNLQADLGVHSYRLGLNEYADLTEREAAIFLRGYRHSHNRTRHADETFQISHDRDAPEEIDWREKGYVTPVKNQGQCGSCWAFSTTGSLEGQHYKKTGKLVSLSEQNLMDCSHDYGNNGCEGGLMDNAFAYIKSNGGIDTEESYPYEARDATCRFKQENVGATVSGYVDIHHNDEEALRQAVATVGPVSVAIDASGDKFHFYKEGIYNNPSCSDSQLDHGVLVVGYGTEDGQDYWLVKNSWGESWGIDGYIKMSRNKNNQCGIATEASYPRV